jgi:serine/threonine-protein kinase RIO1
MRIKQKMWHEALRIPKVAHLIYNESEAVIYRGVKIEKTDEDIKIYSTEADFYKDMTEEFIQTDGFVKCVEIYLKNKYLNQLDRVESWIQKEVNGQKNHKRISNLKKFRENLIIKYNEINT